MWYAHPCGTSLWECPTTHAHKVTSVKVLSYNLEGMTWPLYLQSMWYAYACGTSLWQISNNACASSNMEHCRVQRDGKSRKQAVRLLLTSPSHVTASQVPGSARKSRKKHTVIANKKKWLFWFNTNLERYLFTCGTCATSWWRRAQTMIYNSMSKSISSPILLYPYG